MKDSNMKIIIGNDPAQLRLELGNYTSTATVEAEYGEICVEGTLCTLAHHGSRQGQLCPCLYDNDVVKSSVEVIGLSHVDLDTIGGIMAVMGIKPKNPNFWRAAAFVDTHGPHRLLSYTDNPEVVGQLWSYWAWSQDHRVYPARDGSVLDVTKQVNKHLQMLQVLLGDPSSTCSQDLLAVGEEYRVAQDKLERQSYRTAVKGVVVRHAYDGKFVNAFYTHGEDVHAGVAAYNGLTKAVTISLESPIPGVSCREIVQFLWGKGAGGHDGIAGSPRNQEMSMMDCHDAAVILGYQIQDCRRRKNK